MSGNRGFRRSFRTPPGYKLQPGGRTALFNQTYLGFVKNNEDALMMGRLQVWIPEFSSNPTDESGWFTVSYCSPFAGSTPAKDLKKGGQELADTQQSYGWWAVPPDVDNEVVVMFINGDPNRGVWIGSLYQQYMNNMVPGIPSAKSFQEGEEGIDPPTAEYNKWGGDVGNAEDPTRPRFEPLHEGFKSQGLYEDSLRGPSDASARRDPVSKVYGFKSPGGSQLVFDDADDNSYIRIRTKSGAQVLINDTVGFVYVISGNGNSWLEVSDDGVDAYSANAISLRSQGNLNFHADGEVNIHAGSSFNVYGAGGGSFQFGKNMDMLVGSACNISAAGDMNLLGQGATKVSAGGNISMNAGGTAAIAASGALGVSAGGNLFLKGSQIKQNAGSGPAAAAASEASGPKPSSKADKELSEGYPDATVSSIVSRLPTHEPWAGHPGTKTSPSNNRGLGANQEGVNEEGKGDEVDDEPAVEVPDDGTKFAVPVNGLCGSPYGKRMHPIQKVYKMHTGVDFKSTPQGTPIYASKGGKVTFAGRKGGYGNVVIIDHGKGMTTFYAHQSQIMVAKGQEVKQMQQIGKVGSTGNSTGPHLHFEVRKGGSPINPAQVIPFATGNRAKAGSQK